MHASPIKDRIDRRQLAMLMEQMYYQHYHHLEHGYELPGILKLIDQYFDWFEGDTIKEIQRNINDMLTTSKHLLPFGKQELIWFQQALGKLPSVRGAIRD